MAETPSTMAPIGTEAPDFELTEPLTGRTVSKSGFEGKPLLAMFICNHCPFVIHVADELARLGKQYREKGLGVVAICSNDPTTHPDDAPDKMARFAESHGFAFPYLHDATQGVAKAYTAACTPDFFLFDKDHRLAYRGQLDDARPGNEEPVNGKDLRAAIDAVLQGRPVPEKQRPSTGCNIKWKKGAAPAYA